jgi:hypothetical protein
MLGAPAIDCPSMAWSLRNSRQRINDGPASMQQKVSL